MKSGYYIYVFTSDRDAGDLASYEGIKQNEWIKLNGIYIYYASPNNLKWNILLSIIKDISPDFIYLNSMFSRYFSIYPLLMKRIGKINAKVILAPRGMLRKSALSFKPLKKIIFLKFLRMLNIESQIVFHATDQTELIDIKKTFGEKSTICQLTNFGTSVGDFSKIKKLGGELKLIFIGRIHPIKNLHFLLETLMLIEGVVVLTIVGPIEDAEYWEKCMNTIKQFSTKIYVRFEGNVSHAKIIELLLDHHLFVLPTLGENYGHAIFEALATGRPVLISDQTPWIGLSKHHAGWDLSLADRAEFIKILNFVLLMNNSLFELWCRGAWQYAKDVSQNTTLRKQYYELFN